MTGQLGGSFLRIVNRLFNYKNVRRKVFCIGLHKTGTNSLCEFANKIGYKSLHSTDWIADQNKLKEYEFFCDGGSHFDNMNEFDFKFLFHAYPNSLFILQTRDTKEWIISKLKHAGWNKGTIIYPNDENKITHHEWKCKSLLTIEKFIQHKYNYEKKVVDFFENNDLSRLLVIDITDSRIQLREIERLMSFLKIRSFSRIAFPHANKSKTGFELSEEVLNIIDKTIIG